MNTDVNDANLSEDLPADDTPVQDSRDADIAQQDDGQQTQPAALESFLDNLTDAESEVNPEPPSSEDGQRQRGPDGRFLARDVATAQPSADAAAPGQPQPEEQAQSPEDAEEAELLAGVKSERGRERMRQIFAERREAQTSLTEIREVVASAGVTPQDMAEYLEFARLMSSGDPQNLRQAAQIIETHRAQIYKQLGIDAPGVDGLAEFPDLAQAVEGLQISREHALEIARGRRQQQALAQQQQAQAQHQQEQQQFTMSVEQGKTQMAQFLASRQQEIDHPARMRAVSEYFANPAKLQEFASTYQPHQWAHALRMMYEGIQAPAAPRQPTPAPISSRPAPMGRPAAAAGESPEARTMSILDGMGL